MPPKGASTALQPMRLPPLHKLRVRRPNQADANPCLSIMSSVLSALPRPLQYHLRITNWHTACWASSGYNIAGCQALETQLRACMDTPVSLLIISTSVIKRRGPANNIIITETESPEEKHDQLPFVENVSEYRGPQEEEVRPAAGIR